jgi:hypothetical protein
MCVALVPAASAEGAQAGVIPAAISPAALSECPGQTICLWAGVNFNGQRSFWHASETGCHALANINPQSIFNNTSNRSALLPGWGLVGAGVATSRGVPYTGELCIN